MFNNEVPQGTFVLERDNMDILIYTITHSAPVVMAEVILLVYLGGL